MPYLPSNWVVLHENVAFSILVLSAKKTVFEKGFCFSEYLFQN